MAKAAKKKAKPTSTKKAGVALAPPMKSGLVRRKVKASPAADIRLPLTAPVRMAPAGQASLFKREIPLTRIKG